MKYSFFLGAIVLFIILFPLGTLAANDQVTIEEVEKLIKQEVGKGTPLTNEDLTKALLESKDEKIANLEGNLSKVLSTLGVYVAIASAALAIVSGIIGWVIKWNLDKKLIKIEEKEADIYNTKAETDRIHNETQEFYNKVKSFNEDSEKLKRELNENNELLKKRTEEFKILRQYVGNIENLVDSSITAIKFSLERSTTPDIIQETKNILEQSPKNLNFVILKISKKLGEKEGIKTPEDVQNHFNKLAEKLTKKEQLLIKKIQDIKSVDKEYILYDQSSMKLSDDVESHYDDWKLVWNNILTINNIWRAQLEMKSPPKGE